MSRTYSQLHHFAAYQAVKFYNYSMKKNLDAEPVFKPFVTDEAIAEEDAEIEDFLILKQAHNSEDSFGDDKRSSEEDNNKVADEEEPPALPPPLPKKALTLPPKPPLAKKPPNLSIGRLTKAPHSKPCEDLSKIDKEVNDNLVHTQNAKSTIVPSDLTKLDKDNFSNNNTFIVKEPAGTPDSEEPIQIRTKKPTRVTKTDEEVYAELRAICNMSDPMDTYKKQKEVGKGASGVVFIALDVESQKQVAIKTIDLKNQSSKELILNEIRVLKDFNHHNLVNFLDAYFLEELDHLWVVLEYMNG